MDPTRASPDGVAISNKRKRGSELDSNNEEILIKRRKADTFSPLRDERRGYDPKDILNWIFDLEQAPAVLANTQVSARSQVFDIFELVENIFSHLEAGDLWRAQRTSQFCRGVFRNSPILQRHAFLARGHAEPVYPIQLWGMTASRPDFGGKKITVFGTKNTKENLERTDGRVYAAFSDHSQSEGTTMYTFTEKHHSRIKAPEGWKYDFKDLEINPLIFHIRRWDERRLARRDTRWLYRQSYMKCKMAKALDGRRTPLTDRELIPDLHNTYRKLLLTQPPIARIAANICIYKWRFPGTVIELGRLSSEVKKREFWAGLESDEYIRTRNGYAFTPSEEMDFHEPKPELIEKIKEVIENPEGITMGDVHDSLKKLSDSGQKLVALTHFTMVGT